MKKYLPSLTITMLILVAVLLPGSSVPNVDVIGIDKAAHFILFFLWALAIRYDFSSTKKFYTLLFGAVFSILTEVLQLIVEDRSFDVYDMLADVVGLVSGLMLCRHIFLLLKIYR